MRTVIKYFCTTVFPWDYWISKIFSHDSKLKIGWCSVFPPIPNGAAVMTQNVVQELFRIKNKENIELYALPENGKIDKQKFRGINFAKLKYGLDAVIFFSTDYLVKKYRKKTKYLAWQTLHFFAGEEFSTEKGIFEKLKQADFVIAPTKMALQEYRRAGIKNVAYVPEGIAIDNYHFTFEKKKKVVFVSRRMYYKGILPFLDAVPFIVKAHPFVEICVHAPQDSNSPHLEEINATLKACVRNFPDNFAHYSNWLSDKDVRRVYENAAVLVFPSNNEGFGIPLVEAMASGTICVVSDRAPMNEIVEHNKTGVCLKMKKQEKYHGIAFPIPEDIARSVNRILENPEKYRKLQHEARKKVEKEYDIRNTVQELLKNVRATL